MRLFKYTCAFFMWNMNILELILFFPSLTLSVFRPRSAETLAQTGIKIFIVIQC